MLEVLFALLLFLLLCYLGILFGRLVFVYTIERRTTQFFFVVIFALSTLILSLALLDVSALGGLIFSVRFSTRALHLALAADLAAIAVLCPLCITRLLLHNLHFRCSYVLLIGCGLLLLIFRAWTLSLAWLQRLSGSCFSWAAAEALWDATAAVVAVIGILAVAALSGYAAVTTPVAFLRPFVVKDSGERARVALGVLGKRQRHLLSLWVAKECQIVEMYHGAPSSFRGADAPTRVWSWMAKSLRSTVRGGALRENSDGIARLKAEKDGIQAVSMAVFLQMSEMGSLVRSAESGATWRGLVDALLGVLLLLHAFLKLFFTSINLLRWFVFSDAPAPPVPEDAATRVVRFLETYGLAASQGGEGEQSIVCVSLFLNAWMIVTSIRGLLLAVFRLVTTYATFLSVDTTVLGLTVGMGAYFVGQLLLLRPSPLLESASALGTVLAEQLPRSNMYRHLNDIVFVTTSILTLLAQQYMVPPQTATLHSLAD
ncbi:Golgi pH regulator [Trypanosoma rangeli]|uniref:Golgi pH regulator n=1 Tax=Trypanosoma rangeli TaxID=5698 RepID=A0A3R7JSE8_TRYRA|nr:Golgi pH regulator [Trypanosoma rangeli]RNE96102.1 Golgi pH regulator [Trypanosoma rangeli]|eukprot:RNE96102.1 Golgi pH regulator [Trypanosoma rangeli]